MPFMDEVEARSASRVLVLLQAEGRQCCNLPASMLWLQACLQLVFYAIDASSTVLKLGPQRARPALLQEVLDP